MDRGRRRVTAHRAEGQFGKEYPELDSPQGKGEGGKGDWGIGGCLGREVEISLGD
jgi:hypothetical protein